jgi:hypothetical protein
MSEHEAAGVIGSKSPGRRSLWLTVGLGVLAVAALAIAFSQRTLTAPLPDTVEMADMTWVEVRSAIARGYTVAIVPTGGIEQNGPHMVLGKHDYIVRTAAGRIARELGRTLVTPVVSFVPEGGYDPPTGNMQFPGTLGIPEPVFAQVLEGICAQPQVGRLQDHLLCRRPRRQPGRASRRRRKAQRRMGWPGHDCAARRRLLRGRGADRVSA